MNMEIQMKSETPCKRFKCLDRNGDHIFVDKVRFKTDKEAIEAARVMTLHENTIHRLVAYKCPVCHYWHIGRNRSVLTEKDRKRYSRQSNL
jgi:hypothetical protein